MENLKMTFYFFWIINNLMWVVNGHGRLVDPPGRASMWRYGYDTPVDYNDNQLFCGGFDVQHFQNGGKCGVCGDPYGQPQLNQPPGLYATGIITRTYIMNTNVTMRFEITASHKGFLQLRICPNNDVTKPATQECLDQNVLRDSKTGGTKFYFNWGTAGIYDAHVSLPAGLTCTQCVVQWRYKTGNSWGCINDDPSNPENCGIGLGRQEEFYSCADVAILSSDGSLPTTNKPQSSSMSTTALPPSITSSSSISSHSAPTSVSSTASISSTSIGSVSNECKAAGIYEGNPNIDWWCGINCPGVSCSRTFCSAACNKTSIATSTSQTQQPISSTSTTVTSTISTTPDKITITEPMTTSSRRPSTVSRSPLVCRPRNIYSNVLSVIEWCQRSCALGICQQLLCECSQFSGSTSFFTSTKSTTKASITTLPSLVTTEAPPTINVICTGVGVWINDTAVAAWCNTNCQLGHCPPNTCQCSKEGALTELSYGLGDRCVSLVHSGSIKYKLYMDLWCKHNCPRFNCNIIPSICKC